MTIKQTLQTFKKYKVHFVIPVLVIIVVIVYMFHMKYMEHKESFAMFNPDKSVQYNPVNYERFFLTSSSQDSLVSGQVVKQQDTYVINATLPDARGGDFNSKRLAYHVWVGKDSESIKMIGNLSRDGSGEYRFSCKSSVPLTYFKITITGRSGKDLDVLSTSTK